VLLEASYRNQEQQQICRPCYPSLPDFDSFLISANFHEFIIVVRNDISNQIYRETTNFTSLLFSSSVILA
jgi:hypothetical protein